MIGRLAMAASFLFMMACAGKGVPVVPSPESHFQFADVRWGSSAATVEEAYRAAGLTLSGKNSDSELVFVGSIMGRETGVLAMFRADSLKGVVVMFTQGTTERFFRQLRQEIIQEYGDPSKLFSDWFRYGIREAGGDREVWVVRNKTQDTPELDSIEEYYRVELTGFFGEEMIWIEYWTPGWSSDQRRLSTLKSKIF